MNHVMSKDGTLIAYTRGGDGPAVVLVGGGLDDGSENATLIPALADSFTVVSYARRGRGDSGDTLPYSLEREIEDLAALVDEMGGAYARLRRLLGGSAPVRGRRCWSVARPDCGLGGAVRRGQGSRCHMAGVLRCPA